MELDDVKAKGAQLSPWAHMATVGADGCPDVVPVHPCWEGDVLWVMCGGTSVKARNLAANPNVALHWQVTATGDGLEVWGTATVHDDLDTKRRLWTGVFDYDLDVFDPSVPVAGEVVRDLVALAVRAPSAGFSQGWDFVALLTPQARAAFWAAADDGGPADAWLRGVSAAPALVLCLSDADAGVRARHAGKPHRRITHQPGVEP